jgi:alpha-beta hydrolase superfamily lysophospholipase
MATIPLVLHTEAYYKAFREKHLRWGIAHPPVVAEHFSWTKADVRSRHAHLLLADDRAEADNVAFALPVVLPRRPGPFQRVVVLLHGLNESEYRKYFPWACTLAQAGLPVVLFPLAFLVNRRPPQWRGDAETQRLLRARQAQPGNEVATRYNAILSERLEHRPERLFLGGRQSYFDLLDLAASLRSGTLAIDTQGDEASPPRYPFAAGTQVDWLGFSIGGYLTLGLLLGEPEHSALADSRAIIFAAAAPFVHADRAVMANPLSPFILDRRATERVRAFYRSPDAEALLDNPEGRWCRAIFRAEQQTLAAALRRVRGRLLTIGNTVDRVVPAAGMEATFGRLDCVLELGAHEYPFSLADVWQAGVTRSIAKSYNVHPAYEAGFRRFMQTVIDFLG